MFINKALKKGDYKMRQIDKKKIVSAVAQLVQEANYFLGDDMLKALHDGKREEESVIGQDIFTQLLENAGIAAGERVPVCQDTGVAVIFLEIGNEVYINGNIYDAVNEGVSKGYQEGYLRKSMVKSPIDRINTGDNTPAVIHTRIVPGDKLKIIAAPKGGGSENMSRLQMLKPADGIEGVKEVVIKAVREAGANPCPPIIVGVGIGGNFEKAALMAKEALLRPVDDSSENPVIARLEQELLKDINKLGIGPQGLGGKKTALAVKIKEYPCHIASLPVAVNINCHAARHKEIVL